ncbi:MAG: DUF4465 domain-containing protein [Luteolibacter sp.]
MKYPISGAALGAALSCLVLDSAFAIGVEFESFDLPETGFWNGSDLSGVPGAVGFYGEVPYLQDLPVEGLLFRNTYTDGFGSWSGFAISNHSDTTTAGFGNPYSAYAGSGAGGSSNYAVGYYAAYEESTRIHLGAARSLAGLGAWVTNTTYTALDMLNGSGFSKKFGGADGSDPDWLKLTVTGYSGGIPTGNAVDFYLADYRFTDNAQDCIIRDWTFVDFTPLGWVDELRISMSSSDNGAFGMNTPSFFAIDNILDPLPPEMRGPYSGPLDEPGNIYDAPIPGFVGPHGDGKARLVDGLDGYSNEIVIHPDNFVNPLFFAWGDEVIDYSPSEFVQVDFSDPQWSLGPVTGDHFFGVVSLGDLSVSDRDSGVDPGMITIQFAQAVRDLSGADLVIFENGIIAGDVSLDAVAGQIFGELAYVEVSADGENYVRFPASSLNGAPVGAYGSVDATRIHNLAGKHTNAAGESWGTPFDLAEVGMDEVRYLRIVDIPGDGFFKDSAGRSIYDPWKTFGSGGFDLEAVGVISSSMNFPSWPMLGELPLDQRGMTDDPDGDGVNNLLEYAFARLPNRPDDEQNLPRCSVVTLENERYLSMEWIRDERLIDLVYEVQESSSLESDAWHPVARVTGEGQVVVEPGPWMVSETSAHEIASVGVLRKMSVRAPLIQIDSPRRYLRVKVSSITSSGL